MKIMLKLIGALFGLIILIFAGLAIYVSALDADEYRPQLLELISKQTGRTAKLNGPIAFSLGLGGAHIGLRDASIGNPSWASRPDMAGMGKFDLSVGLLPLLGHRLVVNQLAIENADILLETNNAGNHNWEFTLPANNTAAAKTSKAASASAAPPSLRIEKLVITDSQVAMRAADGKISRYQVKNLNLAMTPSGAVIDFTGAADQAPLALKLKTGITDLLSKSAFPFDADLTYGAIHIIASGNADAEHSKAGISSYTVTSGKTVMKGELSADWGGAHPALRGTLNSDRIDPADFVKSDDAAKTGAAHNDASAASGEKHLFSATPLPLAGLKAADADMTLSIGVLPIGKSELKNITAHLTLSRGDLNLSPFKADVGAAALHAQMRLNAAQTPARLTLAAQGNAVDLGELQKLAAMTPFMTGKAGADMQFAGSGNSPHDMASSLTGSITITAEKGEILGSAASGISSILAKIFNPQGGDTALNCLAMRFNASNGVLTDHGILIDSTPSTLSGKGNINLAAETVDLTLHAKTKLFDVGGVVPAVLISGGLAKPQFKVDTAGTVKNILGNVLAGGKMNLGGDVPALQTAPAGQNACLYTLDHPVAASAAAPLSGPGQSVPKLKDIGKSLMKGLFGH